MGKGRPSSGTSRAIDVVRAIGSQVLARLKRVVGSAMAAGVKPGSTVKTPGNQANASLDEHRGWGEL